MSLIETARAAWARALAAGELHPLASERLVVREGGVDFVVRRMTGFRQKRRGTREEDPFRPPYTDSLYVSDWPPAHAVLLNKFPVLEDHLLIVTRGWADQEEPMDEADWQALGEALHAMDGLGFYNGGRLAGASQPHRHLQLVPREALGPLPLEAAIRAAVERGLDRVPGWPVAHLVSGDTSFERYRSATALHPGPHNLLRTRDWQLFVPRIAADVRGIPVNALGYVGLLVVKDDEQLARVRRDGPWSVLAAAAAANGAR